jgi:hypothetical protein
MLATIQSRTFISLSALKKNINIRIYKTIILSLGLYGCETWSMVLRRSIDWVCLRRMLRRIFVPKRNEVTWGWRKLYNKGLHDLYSSLSIITMIKWRRMRWAIHVAWLGEKRSTYRLLVGKPEWRIPLGRRRRRWVDINKINHGNTGWEVISWTGLAQDKEKWRALVNAVMSLWIR